MWSIEGVDVAGGALLGFGVEDGGPSRGLDGAGDFECEFVEVLFPGVVWDFIFEEETAERTVGGDIVEAVIVDAGVGEVGGHTVERGFATDFEEGLVVGCVESE